MKQLIIFYWACMKKPDNLNYEHKQSMDYNDELLCDIMLKVRAKGYNVMIFNKDNDVILAIDTWRFQQR